MTIANCLENEIECVSPEYADEEVKKKQTLNLKKYPQSTDQVNLISQKYNPKFIINLLAEKHLRGRVFFYFYDRADFISLCSDGQLNVRGCGDALFRFWGNSEFRSIEPKSVFQKLEDKVIRVNFISFSGSGNILFDSFAKFIEWLEDTTTI
jgi:hypothetical protein